MGDQYGQNGTRRENNNGQWHRYDKHYYPGGPKPVNRMPPPAPQGFGNHMIPPAPRDPNDTEFEGTLADVNDPFWLRRRYTRNDSFPELREMDMGQDPYANQPQPVPPQAPVHQQQHHQQPFPPRSTERSGPRQANKPGAHHNNYHPNNGQYAHGGGHVGAHHPVPPANRGQPAVPQFNQHHQQNRPQPRPPGAAARSPPNAGANFYQPARTQSRGQGQPARQNYNQPARGTGRGYGRQLPQPNSGHHQQQPLPPVPSFGQGTPANNAGYSNNNQSQYGQPRPQQAPQKQGFGHHDVNKGFRPPKFTPTFDNTGGNPHFRPPTDTSGYNTGQRGGANSYATHGSQFGAQGTPRTQYAAPNSSHAQFSSPPPIPQPRNNNSRVKRGRQGGDEGVANVLMSKTFAKNRNTPRSHDQPPPLPSKNSRSRNQRGRPYPDY